jgi:hypothetical protein
MEASPCKMESPSGLDYDSYNTEMFNRQINFQFPYCKAINTKAGLFVPKECKIQADWVCETNVGVDFSLQTEQTDLNGELITVEGELIKEPRLRIIERSPLLRFNKKTKRYDALWDKARDQELKLKGEAQSAIRYLLFFVGKDNRILHNLPIQLSLKGNCMFRFDTKLKEFIGHIYTTRTGKQLNVFLGNGDPTISWIMYHSVFCPKFVTEKVGDAQQSFACLAVSFLTCQKSDASDLYVDKEEGSATLDVYEKYRDWYIKQYRKNHDFSSFDDTKISTEAVDV